MAKKKQPAPRKPGSARPKPDAPKPEVLYAELVAKNETLSRLNRDLRNLLNSTRIAALGLDEQLRVRSFTPAMAGLFHLSEGDRGRPITEIAPNIAYPELRADVENVLHNQGVVERTLKNDDGHGRVFMLEMRPYHTMDNVIDGVVLTFVDITDRQKLNQENARLAAIVNASNEAMIGLTLPDRISSWNPAAAKIFGLSAQNVLGKPLNTLLPGEASVRVRAFFSSEERKDRISKFCMTWTRPDGAEIPLEMNWAPVHDEHRKLIAGEIFVRDISEQVGRDRARDLIMWELNHRVKNALSTVQAIAQQTLRSATSLEAFRTTFMVRLIALAKTHNLLAQQGWNGADLREMVQAELQPYQADDKSRIEIRGEPVWLSSAAVMPLSMGLHELATNAAKYGALSVPNGKVSVQWEVHADGHLADGHSPRLHLRWVESGGPLITAQPPYIGFGRCLITEGLACELEGTVTLDFAVTGVVCEIEMPAPPHSTR